MYIVGCNGSVHFFGGQWLETQYRCSENYGPPKNLVPDRNFQFGGPKTYTDVSKMMVLLDKKKCPPRQVVDSPTAT